MNPQQFWDSTLKEVMIYIEVYSEKELQKQKMNVSMAYNIASLVNTFINYSFNNKPIPSIEKIFPNLFSENIRDGLSQEEYDKRLARFQEEQIARNFEMVNKARKKGGN